MAVKSVAPNLVSEDPDRFCRPDDVGKQNRCKAPIAKGGVSGSCEELFDLSYQIGVIGPRKVIRRRNLMVGRCWRVIGEIPAVFDLYKPVVPSVDDQGWGLDFGEQVSNIGISGQREHREGRRRACSPVSRLAPPALEGRVSQPTGCHERKVIGLFGRYYRCRMDQALDEQVVPVEGNAVRVIVGSCDSGVGVDQHQCPNQVRLGRRQIDGNWPGLPRRQKCGLFGLRRLHHREGVVGVLLGGHTRGAQGIGKADTPRIEADDAGEGTERRQIALPARLVVGSLYGHVGTAANLY